MDSVPSVGGTRGIFEIFVPGAFLLLNLAGVGYVFMKVRNIQLDESAWKIASQPVSALTMLVCFGYLLGIVLRLLKTERADTLSGFYRYLQFQVKRILFGQLAGLFLRPLGILLPKGLNNHLHSIVSKIKGRSGIANLEPFPYFAYLDKVVVRTLPISVQKFYDEFWGSCSTAGNKAFFNYCKNTINSLDSKGAADIYASEALVRYVASMFYALAFSSCLVVAALIATARPEFSSFRPALWTFLCVYLVALEVILSNLRPLRAKEVELVFAATLLNYCSGEWPQP